MTEKKKMGAGLVLSVITVLVTVAGLVLYMMNCKTNYFVKTTGTDNTIVACLAMVLSPVLHVMVTPLCTAM